MKKISLISGLLTLALSGSSFANSVADPNNPCLFFKGKSWLLHLEMININDTTDKQTFNFKYTVNDIDPTGSQGNYPATVTDAIDSTQHIDLQPEQNGANCIWGGAGFSNFDLAFMWNSFETSQQLQLNANFTELTSLLPLTSPGNATVYLGKSVYTVDTSGQSYLKQN